jgi:hypothetical protein
MQIKDLVPKHNQVADLYQSADFQVLDQFLKESQVELEQELLALKENDPDFKMVAWGLIKQINLLGTLQKLPQMILTLKEEFARVEKAMSEMRAQGLDPLAKGD